MDVQGLDCIVTGGASGIGAEVVRQLRDGGAAVTVLDRNHADAAGIRAVEVDLSDPDRIDEAVRDLDTEYDVLVNVAGLPGTHDPELVFRVNFLGLRHLTEQLVPRLRADGSIVNVSSIAGFGWPARLEQVNQVVATDSFAQGLDWFRDNKPEGNAYNFSKEAVTVYTLGAGLRMREHGLRINAVLPGAVETPILADFEESMGQDTLDGVKQLLGRHAAAADIAPALLFLAGRDSRWINASTVTVDGGLIGAVAVGLVPPPSI